MYSQGWGVDVRNTRYQPQSRLNADNARHLKLKWVYGLSGDTPRSLPLVSDDTLFMGDDGRGLVALDRETGCERWRFAHEGAIGSAIVAGRVDGEPVLVFNDRTAGTYAVDATGKFLWHAAVVDEPVPWYSGTPLVIEKTVYVPVSSLEVGLAVNPLYGCCTTSGGMAAFELSTGNKRWYTPTIEEPAQPTETHLGFVQRHGPSGAAVWGAPAYDAKRNRLYFGTGQNYSHPTTDTSDAIFSLDATTGEVDWVRQFTANDAYTAACNLMALNHPNCPKPTGPDVDFGAPVMLLEAGTQQWLIAGQKSAEVHAMDPSTGEVRWSRRLGRGGIIGGVHWGMAANEALGMVFVPISDKAILDFPAPGTPQPGLYALDIETGAQRWHRARQSRCEEEACIYGLSAAATAANDVVVIGTMDGFLEVIHATTGELLWSHDAWRGYDAVNGVKTLGGAFDAHGAMLADDLLIMVAGYGYVGQQRAGNALLVFAIDDD